MLGADQVLELDDGTMLSKPARATRRWRSCGALSGRHPLSPFGRGRGRERASGSGARPRRVALDVRPLGEAFLQAYLDAEYDGVRCSVGGYRIEGLGAQLFEEVEGSHFAILGLPLLPLLAFLRERGLLQS